VTRANDFEIFVHRASQFVQKGLEQMTGSLVGGLLAMAVASVWINQWCAAPIASRLAGSFFFSPATSEIADTAPEDLAM